MGKITDENRRILSESSDYDPTILLDLNPSFAYELNSLITSKKIRVQTIVEATGLSKSYINDLRNLKSAPRQPSRKTVLNIGLALNASLDEMNTLLKTSNHRELYARSSTDAFIIWGMMHKLSGKQIRSKLDEMEVKKEQS